MGFAELLIEAKLGDALRGELGFQALGAFRR
jgi:hypothetical protein